MSILTATDPDEAEGWEIPRYAPIRLDAFIHELSELYRPPLRAHKTWTGILHALNVVAELVEPHATTAVFTPALIARVIASRPSHESAQTTHSIIARIRAACSYARSQGYIRSSPFDYRKSWVKVGRSERQKHHSQEDIRRVLDLLAAERDGLEGWPRWRACRLQALVATVAYSGLRAMEANLLYVDDIDFAHRMIFLVERSRRLKTEAASQPIPMPSALIPILETWLGDRSIAEPAASCPFLFPGVTFKGAWLGGPYGYRAIDQIKAAGERAGVQGFTFLSLRHSYATHAESWGLSPAMIHRVLRHTSLGTQKHYRHPDLDNMRAAVDGIEFGKLPPALDEGPTS